MKKTQSSVVRFGTGIASGMALKVATKEKGAYKNAAMKEDPVNTAS